MLKSIDSKNKKLHFKLSVGDDIIKIRAVCLIIQDYHKNCLFIQEQDDSYGYDVIGFCGGVVEEFDEDIIETCIREAYEECLLDGNETSDWKNIYNRIKHHPMDGVEKMFQYVWHQTIYNSSTYIHSEGVVHELKTIYYIIQIPIEFSNFMINKFKMYSVPISTLDALYKIRDIITERNALKFPLLTNRGYATLRRREIRCGRKKFVDFLQYNIPYNGLNVPDDMEKIVENMEFYTILNNGRKILENVRGISQNLENLKLSAIIVCITKHMMPSRETMNKIFDWTYKTNNVKKCHDAMIIVKYLSNPTLCQLSFDQIKILDIIAQCENNYAFI